MSERELGWGALLAGRNGVRSLALAGGVALHAINVYVATTILPSVVADIGGLDFYAWNTTLFVVASIIGSALSAKLLQGTGPRGAYLTAVALFAAGTLVCAFAPTMEVMLVGRTIQGLGGGFLFALSYAMIRIVFDEALWPRAMALVSGMWGVATLVGPAVGGIFAELNAWRAAFWIMIPLALLFGFLAFATLPARNQDGNERSNLPFAQLFLLVVAVLALSVGSVRADLAWNAAGLAVAATVFALLVLVERGAVSRLLPRGSFSVTAPLGVLFATMSLLAITVTASEIFVPLFLQVLHAQPPLVAGYLAAAMAAGWTVGSIASSGAQGRGAARVIVAAPVLGLLGLVTLSLLVPTVSDGRWLVLGPITVALLIVGFGVGLGWPHLLTRVLQVAPKDEQDLASVSITTVQLCATAVGAALAGMVVNLGGLTVPGGVPGTSSAAFWLFAAFSIAPLAGILTAVRAAVLKQGVKASV
ncbi:MFS transporter [Ensifer sp. Root31]|uniref:MFS transporter n=1 Tax=Ensifer sp. Root31 TaxID=1736512 RepID=UPI00070E2745|nr:MFS transporter [Ensifer sp. Root31]KQU88094.1 MFS transporter [Ensifer sp. Root31]